MSSQSTALVRMRDADITLMPPPPVKRLKRPAVVLDEDEYTETLSNIIARDYFPGLAEVKAQEEYLSALDSDNKMWIAEAGQRLRDTANSTSLRKGQRTSRDTSFDTPRSWHNRTPVADTPKSSRLGDTPLSVHERDSSTEGDGQAPTSGIDTRNLSLTTFQARYTSEDNESFNTVLDKQNNKRREKYAYLWSTDQRIPSTRLITQRSQEAQALERHHEQKSSADKEGRELVPLTTGAVATRPAKPDSWHQKQPDNTFMFLPSSVDEHGLETIMQVKEANSKAGPKETVYANTRFPSLSQLVGDQDPGPVPPSPSLNTDIIARRDTARAAGCAQSEVSSAPIGGETPRVNGYAYVDEDEPDDYMERQRQTQQPSYRDLLAGQVGDATPNPFKIHEKSKREGIHHRLVENEMAKKRSKEKETMRTPLWTGGKTPVTGNMTPAARKLMEKLGRTPVASQGGKAERMSSHDMWTPVATPRKR